MFLYVLPRGYPRTNDKKNSPWLRPTKDTWLNGPFHHDVISTSFHSTMTSSSTKQRSTVELFTWLCEAKRFFWWAESFARVVSCYYGCMASQNWKGTGVNWTIVCKHVHLHNYNLYDIMIIVKSLLLFVFSSQCLMKMQGTSQTPSVANG